jgi:hypothetical protein
LIAVFARSHSTVTVPIFIRNRTWSDGPQVPLAHRKEIDSIGLNPFLHVCNITFSFQLQSITADSSVVPRMLMDVLLNFDGLPGRT